MQNVKTKRPHQLPFLQASTTQYKKMELIIMDLTGPMSVQTWSGMLYALILVEAHSRYRVGQLLKLKDSDTISDTLKVTITMLECQLGVKVKKIRTDNSKEFVNDAIKAFCKHKGILHEMTAPYTPEQNGIVEWVITTYFEMVRCMLHASGMDLCY